jgi:hypothetical protein
MTALPELKKIDKSTRPVKPRRQGMVIDLREYFDLSGHGPGYYFFKYILTFLDNLVYSIVIYRTCQEKFSHESKTQKKRD